MEIKDFLERLKLNAYDKATYSAPHQYSDGVLYLMINGKLVIEDGRYSGELAGKPIRMNKK